MAHHLTLEERDRIAQLQHQGADQKEIARAVGRCPATISRELRRNRTDGLATLVDRKSRFTIVVKVQSKNADHVHEKIKQRLKELDDQRRHSITFDSGTEFVL